MNQFGIGNALSCVKAAVANTNSFKTVKIFGQGDSRSYSEKHHIGIDHKRVQVSNFLEIEKVW